MRRLGGVSARAAVHCGSRAAAPRASVVRARVVISQQAALSRADYENNHSMSALGEKAVIPDNYIAPNAVEGWEKP